MDVITGHSNIKGTRRLVEQNCCLAETEKQRNRYEALEGDARELTTDQTLCLILSQVYITLANPCC